MGMVKILHTPVLCPLLQEILDPPLGGGGWGEWEGGRMEGKKGGRGWVIVGVVKKGARGKAQSQLASSERWVGSY